MACQYKQLLFFFFRIRLFSSNVSHNKFYRYTYLMYTLYMFGLPAIHSRDALRARRSMSATLKQMRMRTRVDERTHITLTPNYFTVPCDNERRRGRVVRVLGCGAEGRRFEFRSGQIQKNSHCPPSSEWAPD